MKHLLHLLITLFITSSLSAQAPQRMTYQAVMRDATSTLIQNKSVGIRISILQGTPTGNSVYAETHTASTNANGLVSLEVGGGSAQSASFSSIDWSKGPYFIKTEVDPTGGSSYTISGSSQLLSVPYALYAATSGSGSSSSATTVVDNLTSSSTTSALSANQGKVLKELIDATKTSPGSSSSSLTGDVSSTGATTKLDKIQGNILMATTPLPGQALRFNGLYWGPTTETFTGDVTGTYAANKVTQIQNIPIAPTAPANGQSLKYNGASWIPEYPYAYNVQLMPQIPGLYAATVQDALYQLKQQIVGATSIAHDGTMSGSGITGSPLGLSDGAVTTSKLADKSVNMSKLIDIAPNTLIGRSTSGSGSPETITIGSGLALNGGVLSAAASGNGTITGITAGPGLTGGGTSGNINIGLDVNSLKSSLLLSNVDNTSDKLKPISDATKTALDLKEDKANKSTDGTLISNSDTKYPTEQAVKTYVDSKTVIHDTSLSGSGISGDPLLITNQAITPAKMANMSNNSIIGRFSPGSGSPEYISIGTGLSLSGGSLSASGVTNINALPPLITAGTTGTGTVTIAMATIDNNTILGNNTGGKAVPSAISASLLKSMIGITKADIGLGNVENIKVPIPGGSDANKVLTVNASGVPVWLAPSGGSGSGDMLASTYDPAGIATQVVGLTSAQTLINKTIAAGSNTITGLTNANLSGSAGIIDDNLATISTAGKVANSATTATTSSDPNTIVLRDGSGNIPGTIASSANFTGSLAGDVTGTQAATVIAANAVTDSKIASGITGSKITGPLPNATSINGVEITPAGTGFSLKGGTTTSKTLIVTDNATVSGTNTGDQILTVSSGKLNLTGSPVSSVDVVTSLTAGSGLSGIGTTGDITLNLAENGITAVNLKGADGNKLDVGASGRVLAADGLGKFKWIDLSGSISVDVSKISLASNMLLTGGSDGIATAINRNQILLSELGEPSVAVKMGSQKITNLKDPDDPQDAATKKYVDDHFPSSLIGAVIYKGTYDAQAGLIVSNSKALPAASADVTNGNLGHYYVVTTAGSPANIGSLNVGDWVISDGTNWSKVANGTISYTTDQVPETATPTNKYFTDARVAANATVQGKEDKINRKPDLSTNSDDYYPSVKAVKAYVDAKVPDASSSPAQSVLTLNSSGQPVWQTPTTTTNVAVTTGSATQLYPTFVSSTTPSSSIPLNTSSSSLYYTPSSETLTAKNFSGNGSLLTNLNATNLTSGTIPSARYGNGSIPIAALIYPTPLDGTKYLAGDGTWKAGGGATNLTYTASSTTGTLSSSTGTGTTIPVVVPSTTTPVVTQGTSGLMIPNDKAKLNTLPSVTNAAASTNNFVLTSNNDGTATWKAPSASGISTASNGLTVTTNDVALGGTLTKNTTVDQGANTLTINSVNARTVINGNFELSGGRLYARVPRLHPTSSSGITWQDDDVQIVIGASPLTFSGTINFPDATLPINKNRLICITNVSGSPRTIADTAGGSTGIYNNEQFTQLAANSVTWFICDGTSWRRYAGR